MFGEARTIRSLALAAGLLLPAASSCAADVAVVYTADLLANFGGGIDSGSAYLDNLDISLEWGRADTTLFVYGLYNNGAVFSPARVGDLQGVSNIETDARAVRLYEAWIDRTFLGGRASLRTGLYDVNSEFDAIETGALFINSAHGIGTDFGQSGVAGPSIFPMTSLAVRGHFDLSNGCLLRMAVLDGVPGDPDHPENTTIHLSRREGVLVVAETNVALARSRLGLGGWRYTAEFTALATAVPGRRNGGVYAFGEWETGAPGHRAFLRVGWANPDYNVFSNYVGAGWVSTSDTGQFGIAVARGGTGSPYRRLQPSDASELTLEVTLRHQWRDWLAVQPDLQYVVHPGAGARLGNTWVMGMRLIVEPTGH